LKSLLNKLFFIAKAQFFNSIIGHFKTNTFFLSVTNTLRITGKKENEDIESSVRLTPVSISVKSF